MLPGVCVWPVPSWISVSHSEIMLVVPMMMGDDRTPRHQHTSHLAVGLGTGGSGKSAASSSFPCRVSLKYRKIMSVLVCAHVQVVIHVLSLRYHLSYLRQRLSLVWSLLVKLHWVACENQGPILPLPPQHWDNQHTPPHMTLLQGTGNSGPHACVYQLSDLPRPRKIISKAGDADAGGDEAIISTAQSDPTVM